MIKKHLNVGDEVSPPFIVPQSTLIERPEYPGALRDGEPIMRNRILLAVATGLLLTSIAIIQPAQAHGEYYERGCDSCGRIVSIQSIGQRSNRLGGGTVLGAIVGGALGNQVGKGDGRKAATVAGLLAGGAIGHNVEKNNRRSRSSYRILVRMDHGRTASFEQSDVYDLRRGDRVYIDNGYVVPAR